MHVALSKSTSAAAHLVEPEVWPWERSSGELDDTLFVSAAVAGNCRLALPAWPARKVTDSMRRCKQPKAWLISRTLFGDAAGN